MKKIKRSITTTTVHFGQVHLENKELNLVQFPVLVFNGEKVSEENALKEIRKVHGKDSQFIITEMEYTTDVYEILMRDFIQYATKIENEELTQA